MPGILSPFQPAAGFHPLRLCDDRRSYGGSASTSFGRRGRTTRHCGWSLIRVVIIEKGSPYSFSQLGFDNVSSGLNVPRCYAM